jgi:microcystin-dependent protein
MSADAIVLDVQVSVSSNATTTVLPAGGAVPFSIRSPYLGMNWLVATQGIFPSRS